MMNFLMGLVFLSAICFLYFKYCHEGRKDLIILAVGLSAITMAQQLGGSLLIVRARHFTPLFMTAGLVYGYRRLRGTRGLLFWLMVISILLLLASSAWHDNPLAMFKAKFKSCFMMILIVWAGNMLATAKDLKKLFVVLIPSVCFVAMVIATGQVDVGADGRMSINEVNQNALGVSASFLAVVAFGVIFYTKIPVLLKTPLCLLFAFGVLKCASSGSRSATVAMVGAVLCMVYPYVTKSRKFLTRGLPIIIVGVVGVCALIARLDADLFARLMTLTEFSGREDQWADMFDHVRHVNSFLGTGGWYRIDLDGSPAWLGSLNIYVDYYYNCGLLGVLVGGVTVLVALVRMAAYSFRFKVPIVYPIVAFCVMGFLHGWGEDGAMRYGNLIGFLFQLGMGLLSGLSMRNARLYDFSIPLKEKFSRSTDLSRR